MNKIITYETPISEFIEIEIESFILNNPSGSNLEEIIL
jgi:hypothetical protein